MLREDGDALPSRKVRVARDYSMISLDENCRGRCNLFVLDGATLRPKTDLDCSRKTGGQRSSAKRRVMWTYRGSGLVLAWTRKLSRSSSLLPTPESFWLLPLTSQQTERVCRRCYGEPQVAKPSVALLFRPSRSRAHDHFRTSRHAIPTRDLNECVFFFFLR